MKSGKTPAGITQNGTRSGSITALVIAAVWLAYCPQSAAAQANLTSFQTTKAAQYAKVREYAGGTPVQTWPASNLTNLGGGQATPAYSDVQQIRYSTSNIYINANGLASYIMGPWYAGPNLFGRWPSSLPSIYKFPKSPSVAATKTTAGGDTAVLVNGVVLFSYGDAFSYKTSAAADQMMTGDNIWNRLAYPAEGATFDPAEAHQPGSGQYHNHSNPIGLRFQLGDNVNYSAATDSFAEDTTSLHHSPILGWAWDGYPIYGPYGYSTPMDSSSAVRRIKSGYVLRNGANGTTNLATTGRSTLPAWAATAQNRAAALINTQFGPAVNATYSLGRYAEDYDYVAAQGDLDQYNGRTCLTPEFPTAPGMYAYFVTIDSAGDPAFPNVVGPQFYGNKTGGRVMNVTEPTTTYYINNGTAGVEEWVEY